MSSGQVQTNRPLFRPHPGIRTQELNPNKKKPRISFPFKVSIGQSTFKNVDLKEHKKALEQEVQKHESASIFALQFNALKKRTLKNIPLPSKKLKANKEIIVPGHMIVQDPVAVVASINFAYMEVSCLLRMTEYIH